MKNLIALALIALTTGCSTYNGTNSTTEMEFCWERGMNFTWVDEFDAGCIDTNGSAMRIAKIRWEEQIASTDSNYKRDDNTRLM